MPIIIEGPSAVPPGLFNQNVNGRINPVGNFTGFTHSIEYFFALPPNPLNNPLGATLAPWVFTGFSSSCPTIASTKAYSPVVLPNGTIVSYILQEGFWKFDHKGAVVAYDLTVASVGDVVNAVQGDQTNPYVQAATIAYICQEIQSVCIGDNHEYNSVDDCIAQLTAKPYGTFADAWSDTVACRLLHVTLALVDPLTHCPHVGPTGGGKCVTYPYVRKYVLDNVQLFGSQRPFICPFL